MSPEEEIWNELRVKWTAERNRRVDQQIELAEEWRKASNASRESLLRYTMVGAGAGIGIIATRLSDVSGAAQVLVTFGLVAFAFALFYAYQARQSLMVAEADHGLDWVGYAEQLFEVLVKDEAAAVATGEWPGTPWPEPPQIDLKEYTTYSSRAFGLLVGGGINALLAMIVPLPWSVLWEDILSVATAAERLWPF